jgi:hypothetical protein
MFTMNFVYNLKKAVLVSALTVGLSLSLVSAKPAKRMPASMPAAAEVQAVGGDDCDGIRGLGVGLIITGLVTPCGPFCIATGMMAFVVTASC